jgi:hypothetical protein
MRQAALQHGALRVLAVNEVPASPWTGNPAVMEQDAVMLRQAQQAAEDAVSKAAGELGETERPEVTVTAMNGFARPRSSSTPPKTRTCLSWARAANSASPPCVWAQLRPKSLTTPNAHSPSCRPPVKNCSRPSGATTIPGRHWPAVGRASRSQRALRCPALLSASLSTVRWQALPERRTCAGQVRGIAERSHL